MPIRSQRDEQHRDSWVSSFFNDRYIRFDQLRKNDAELEAHNLLSLLRGYQPRHSIRRVTEFGCGYGRLLLPLSKEVDTLGVDQSLKLLTHAQAKASSAQTSARLVNSDLRSFGCREHCDAVVLAATTFGYFGLPEDSQILSTAYASLVPGGLILIDQLNNPPSTPIRETIDTESLLLNRDFDPSTRVFRGEYIYQAPGETRSFPYKIFLYRAETLSELLRVAGFRSVRLFGSLEAGVYSEVSERQIAVAMKE